MKTLRSKVKKSFDKNRNFSAKLSFNLKFNLKIVERC